LERVEQRSVGGGRVVELADPQDVIVEKFNASCLREQGLAHREGKLLLQSLVIGLDGRVLFLLRGLHQRPIAATEFGFDLGPNAIEFAGDGFALSDITDALVVKDGFEVAAKFGANQRFIEEVELESGVLEFLADLPQACLAVDEAIDDGAE
jgi:hypothetical protein